MAYYDSDELSAEIQKLKKERGAVILAHNYCPGAVQDLADFTGDSLELSIKAADAGAEVIVFCGVSFMAETAKLLSPDKKVILPGPNAGCPMADMTAPDALRELKRQHPDALVVTYVNSTAAVKAESDVCVTSANAEKIVAALPRDREIIFAPDRNLGAYVSRKLNRPMILWKGFCPVHNRLKPEDFIRARNDFPGVKILAHPECPPNVAPYVDEFLSTGGICRCVKASADRDFVIATEAGILHRLRKENPGKRFFLLSEQTICASMKMTDLPELHHALLTMEKEVQIPADIAERARKPIRKMLEMSK